MGLRDILLGRRQLAGPAPDRLFAITTAYVTLQAEGGVEPAGAAAIVFQALATTDFSSTLGDMEEVVRSTCADSGIGVEDIDDDFGYRWMVLRPGNVEDLAVGINAVSGALEGAGYGDRLLCAVFAFKDTRPGRAGNSVYFIYNYKRGYWYPFVPRGQNEHDTERELQLKAQAGTDLPIEPELERWFPLWGTPI